MATDCDIYDDIYQVTKVHISVIGLSATINNNILHIQVYIQMHTLAFWYNYTYLKYIYYILVITLCKIIV